VRSLLERIQGDYEERWETCFEIGFSTQDPATNTLAVDLEGRPFRDEAGELVFRPGGHGALVTNLNALDADIVFVKNIDNCVPDRLKLETVYWKRILAGYLLALQEEIFAALRLLTDGSPVADDLERITAFGQERLNLVFPLGFSAASPTERCRILRDRLHRPLRVCGMVRNEGEPGGGPFWVADRKEDGGAALQIVEADQIDGESAGQREIWEGSSYFNPVDLVCGVRDEQGRKYDLTAYVDPATALIVRKSEKGRPLLALERPGLWNGGMAFWNTVFVEVPLATFNPVKNISDLLRPQHLPG